jgi:hypothetical protein
MKCVAKQFMAAQGFNTELLKPIKYKVKFIFVKSGENNTIMESIDALDQAGKLRFSDIRNVAIQDTNTDTDLKVILMYATQGDETEVLTGTVPAEWCTQVYDDPEGTKMPKEFEMKDASGKVEGALKLQLRYVEPEQ